VKTLAAGTRIELIDMPNDPDPIPPGTRGTVKGSWLNTFGKNLQVDVDWDNGRRLLLVCPPDKFKIVTG
jgi:hypothetical protein